MLKRNSFQENKAKVDVVLILSTCTEHDQHYFQFLPAPLHFHAYLIHLCYAWGLIIFIIIINLNKKYIAIYNLIPARSLARSLSSLLSQYGYKKNTFLYFQALHFSPSHYRYYSNNFQYFCFMNFDFFAYFHYIFFHLRLSSVILISLFLILNLIIHMIENMRTV